MSKRKASPPPNKPLGGKCDKSLAPPNSSPKTPVLSLSSLYNIASQDKIPSSSKKNKWPPVDSFWESYGSNYVWDYLRESQDYNMYMRKTHYIYKWLGLFVQGLSGNKIAAAFLAITLE